MSVPRQLFLILVVEKFLIVILLTIFINNDIFSVINPTKQKFCPLLTKSTDLRKTSLKEVESDLEYLGLEYGGKWKPKNCRSRFKLAVIVPYRDRLSSLKLFLRNLHPFLNNQNIQYGIYLIEQDAKSGFNRALLINAGFIESLKDENWNCFIFHDVDMIPENTNIIYNCSLEAPKHMAAAISSFGYSGVLAFSKQQFININGFSNLYFNWGSEDDDARLRVLSVYHKIIKLRPEIGRFYANPHKRQKINKKRKLLQHSALSRMVNDGLNSIQYNLTGVERTYLYTRVFISVKNVDI